MNNIGRLFEESGNIKEFAKGYFSYLSKLFKQLDTDEIAAFIEELELARENQNTIFIAGNGGSAATASHMANDIGLAVLKKGGDSHFRVMALTDNVAVMTAIANDDGYENMFVKQLQVHYRSGDRLVAISASGNSINLLKAAEWVKAREGKVMGLVGFDGGELKGLCDLLIHVHTPTGEYGPVEDVHMIIDHLITSWLHHSA